MKERKKENRRERYEVGKNRTRPDTRPPGVSPMSCRYSPLPSLPSPRHPLPCLLHQFLSLLLNISDPLAVSTVEKARFRVFAPWKKNAPPTDLRTDQRTDQRINGRTDRPSYRDARTHLKRKEFK